MPRRKSIPRSISPSRESRKVPHAEKLRFLSQYKRVSDPTNIRSVAKQYATFKRFPLYLQKTANKEQRAELRKHGFFTTDKGVIIDIPRTAKREPIKGMKFDVLKGGVVTYRNGSRRDYIVGFTKAEKKEFAKDPAKFSDEFEKKWRKKIVGWVAPKKIRDFQLRLQWGAYQATKDFSPRSFSGRYPYIESMVKGKAVQDRMTGFHIVVHVYQSKRAYRKRK